MSKKKKEPIFDDSGHLLGVGVYFEEQDFSEMDKIIVRFQADDLLIMYESNDPLITERIAVYGASVMTH